MSQTTTFEFVFGVLGTTDSLQPSTTPPPTSQREFYAMSRICDVIRPRPGEEKRIEQTQGHVTTLGGALELRAPWPSFLLPFCHFPAFKMSKRGNFWLWEILRHLSRGGCWPRRERRPWTAGTLCSAPGRRGRGGTPREHRESPRKWREGLEGWVRRIQSWFLAESRGFTPRLALQ